MYVHLCICSDPRMERKGKKWLKKKMTWKRRRDMYKLKLNTYHELLMKIALHFFIYFVLYWQINYMINLNFSFLWAFTFVMSASSAFFFYFSPNFEQNHSPNLNLSIIKLIVPKRSKPMLDLRWQYTNNPLELR